MSIIVQIYPTQQKEQSENRKKGKVRNKATAMNKCAAWHWEEKIMRENLRLICALARFPSEVTYAACVTCIRCERKKVSLMVSKNVICTKQEVSANHELIME